MSFTILKFTDVFVPIRKAKCALAMPFTVLKFTNVFISVGKYVGALPISFTVFVFANILAFSHVKAIIRTNRAIDLS